MVLAEFKRAGFVQRDVDLRSGRLRVYEEGSGEPLVLLHGFGVDALENWHEQARSLSRDRHVIAVDLYWFGASRPRVSVADAHAEAASVLELLDALSVARFDLVGTSYGGLVAIDVALAQPARIKRLVLADAASLSPTEAERRAILARFGHATRLEDVLMPRTVEALRRVLSALFYQRRWLPRFVLRQALTELHRNETAKLELIRRLEGELYSAGQLAPLRMPTLIIWGRHDPLLPVALGQRLQAALPNARFLVFERSGHSPMLEEPTRFGATVNEFLEHAAAP